MRNAAAACFLEIKKFFSGNLAGKKALLLCGQGNNGGDGAAIAQELLRAGVTADLILFGRIQDSKGDALANFEIVQRLAKSEVEGETAPLSFVECNSDTDWTRIAGSQSSYDLIVDALFGTGLSRPLGGVFPSVIEHLQRINRDGSPKCPLIVSVDIPSGLNADLPNTIGPAVQADLTVTFTAPKVANVLPPACHLNGTLVVADIGSPRELVDAVDSELFLIEKDDARNWLVTHALRIRVV